jgi:homoserine kinase
MRVNVAVPASVANLGPGFDILGLALQLQNDVRAEQVEGDDLTIDPGSGAPDEFRDPQQNLVSRAYVYACEVRLGVQGGGVHFTCVNRIPIGRGMGSSAAAVLSGVLIAAALHRAPWDENDVLDCAEALEGHRDNLAASLLGGLAISAPGAPAVQMPVAEELRAVLFIPETPFATIEARKVVPEVFSRSDAIFNASRCALLVRALAIGDHASLRVAMQDRWHQEARFARMPGTSAIVDSALAAGASGAALAGAGPSVIALTPLDPAPITAAMSATATAVGVAGRTMVLSPRNYGTRVDVSS